MILLLLRLNFLLCADLKSTKDLSHEIEFEQVELFEQSTYNSAIKDLKSGKKINGLCFNSSDNVFKDFHLHSTFSKMVHMFHFTVYGGGCCSKHERGISYYYKLFKSNLNYECSSSVLKCVCEKHEFVESNAFFYSRMFSTYEELCSCFNSMSALKTVSVCNDNPVFSFTIFSSRSLSALDIEIMQHIIDGNPDEDTFLIEISNNNFIKDFAVPEDVCNDKSLNYAWSRNFMNKLLLKKNYIISKRMKLSHNGDNGVSKLKKLKEINRENEIKLHVMSCLPRCDGRYYEFELNYDDHDEIITKTKNGYKKLLSVVLNYKNGRNSLKKLNEILILTDSTLIKHDN